MATEHPRRHVWTGDDNSTITYFISIYTDMNLLDLEASFIVNVYDVTAAMALVMHQMYPLSDDWGEIFIFCRPLHDYEVDKVSLELNEIIQLDEDSRIRLLAKPTNGEDDGD